MSEPQPAASSSVTPMNASEELMALWPTFLERLGAQKMSLAAYLADSKPLHLDGGIMTIGLPGFSLHQEVLSVAENRRLIDRLLSELCQTAVSVQYATLPEFPEPPQTPASTASAESASPIVQDIVKLFNATILDKPRPTG